LLDQRVVAGLGNIYAAESLWLARVDPRTEARTLSAPQRREVVRAIRHVLARARRSRRSAYDSAGTRFNVYGRAGEPCRRCRTPIARIVQAGRSTYYCPRCQRS
jgi:formamidopyrimidine-DNA glycosylase